MKPTLRENYRYVALEISSETPLAREDLARILEGTIEFIGKIHYPSVMPRLAYFDQKNQRAIVRCLNQGVDELKTALAMTTHYEKDNTKLRIHLRPIYTSGTIRKAKEKLGI